MLSDDLLDSVSPIGSRLSSCSLDSVIGYLDQLLGRKEKNDDQQEIAKCQAVPVESNRRDTSGDGRMLAPSPIRSGCGRTTAVPKGSERLPVEMEDEEDDDDEGIQRVMDLSFASVYEMPSSTSTSGCIPVRSTCQKVMTVLTESIEPTESSLDSGVESNKSDDESCASSTAGSSSIIGSPSIDVGRPLRHDYQNLVGCESTTVGCSDYNSKQSHSCQQQRRSARRYGNIRSSESSTLPTLSSSMSSMSSMRKGNSSRCKSHRLNERDTTTSSTKNNNNNKDDKFYEICLGHLCLQMEAGNSAAGTGLGFDRWISIFSLQKHQDELIQLSASPSSPSSSSSTANHYHQHHQAHNQQGKRLPQRHHSSGGSVGGTGAVSTNSRQNSQDDSVINSGRNNNGKLNILTNIIFLF